MEKWRGLGKTYKEMAENFTIDAYDTVPRATLYRLIGGIYELHAGEIDEIHR